MEMCVVSELLEFFCPESCFSCLSLVLFCVHVMLMNMFHPYVYTCKFSSLPKSAAMPTYYENSCPICSFCNQLCFILNRRCQYVGRLSVCFNIMFAGGMRFTLFNMNIHPSCFDSIISLCLSCIQFIWTLLYQWYSRFYPTLAHSGDAPVNAEGSNDPDGGV